MTWKKRSRFRKMGLKTAYRKIRAIWRNTWYFHFYYRKKLDEKMIFLESNRGKEISSNLFYVLKELEKEEYQEYKIYLACQKKWEEQIRRKLEYYHMDHIQLVFVKSNMYYKCLGIAKYMFIDYAMLESYVKKEGQIVTVIWNGIPVKKIGMDSECNKFAMGNLQRTMLCSDYIVCSNEYTKNILVHAFELEELYNGVILKEGCPQDIVLLDKNRKSLIKKELNLEEKQVYLYMPAWRGKQSKRLSCLNALGSYLDILEQQLTDSQIFYVKMHAFATDKIDYSKYHHIKRYPEQYDVSEFMHICDVLITDYSNVLYDFYRTGKKVILFPYDESDNREKKDFYMELDDFPFPIVKDAIALSTELRRPKSKQEGSISWIENDSMYDDVDTAFHLCSHIIKGRSCCKEEKLKKNGKDNVLLYSDSLALNGLTTSFLNLFNSIDLEKRNYYVLVVESEIRKAPERIQKIPKGIGLLPINNGENYTLMEAISAVLYMECNKNYFFIKKYMDRLYEREFKKYFGSVKIDTVIQFSGYKKKIIHLFQRFHGRKAIFVHNDMIQEIKVRKNQHYLSLQSAYQNYDKVAVVTKDIIPPTLEISKRKDNIVVVNNCHAYDKVIERSLQPLTYDEKTKSTVSIEELERILNSDAKKIISIGRFSPEKGHKMLMKAFEIFSKQYPNTYLVIIGGHGSLYKETVSYAQQSSANIVIIKSMTNPMPVLRRCDLFMLSSYYEGLGLTILEADCLSIPTISTDIVGPQGFMKEYGGYLVEATQEGILSGMNAFMEGKVKAMNVDYKKYNEHAVAQFEKLFE